MKILWQLVAISVRAATARQPDLRPRVVADDRAVEIAEPIDLGAAEKPDRDAPTLQPIAEHLGHRHGRQRRFAELTIPDRQRQDGRLRFDRPGLVHESQPRRMCQASEVARRRRQPNPDKTHIVVAPARGQRRRSSSRRQ